MKRTYRLHVRLIPSWGRRLRILNWLFVRTDRRSRFTSGCRSIVKKMWGFGWSAMNKTVGLRRRLTAVCRLHPGDLLREWMRMMSRYLPGLISSWHFLRHILVWTRLVSVGGGGKNGYPAGGRKLLFFLVSKSKDDPCSVRSIWYQASDVLPAKYVQWKKADGIWAGVFFKCVLLGSGPNDAAADDETRDRLSGAGQLGCRKRKLAGRSVRDFWQGRGLSGPSAREWNGESSDCRAYDSGDGTAVYDRTGYTVCEIARAALTGAIG